MTLHEEIDAVIDAKFGTAAVDRTYEHMLGGILDDMPSAPISVGTVIPDGKIWYMRDNHTRCFLVQYHGQLYGKDDFEEGGSDYHDLPDLTYRFFVEEAQTEEIIEVDMPTVNVNVRHEGELLTISFKFGKKEYNINSFNKGDVKKRLNALVAEAFSKQVVMLGRGLRKKVTKFVSGKINRYLNELQFQLAV